MYRLGWGGSGGKCQTLDGLCLKPSGSTVVDTTCVGCVASVLLTTWEDSSRFLNLLRTKRIEIIVSFLIPTIFFQLMGKMFLFGLNYIKQVFTKKNSSFSWFYHSLVQLLVFAFRLFFRITKEITKRYFLSAVSISASTIFVHVFCLFLFAIFSQIFSWFVYFPV